MFSLYEFIPYTPYCVLYSDNDNAVESETLESAPEILEAEIEAATKQQSYRIWRFAGRTTKDRKSNPDKGLVQTVQQDSTDRALANRLAEVSIRCNTQDTRH